MGKTIIDGFRCPVCSGLRNDYESVISPCNPTSSQLPECTGPCPSEDHTESFSEDHAEPTDLPEPSEPAPADDQSPCLICPCPLDIDSPTRSPPPVTVLPQPNSECDGE